jgi:tetratricopeptide (TPR) repeat protein
MSGPFGKLETLVRQLDIRLADHPDFADLLHLRGLGHAFGGDTQVARRDLTAALRLNPEYLAAAQDLAWLDAWFAADATADATVDAGETRASGERVEIGAAWRSHLEVVRALRVSGPAAAMAALEPAWPDGAAGASLRTLDRLWAATLAERWDVVDSELARLASEVPDQREIFESVGLLRGEQAVRAGMQLWAACYRGNPHGAALCRASADLALQMGAAGESHGLLRWGAALSLDLCAYQVALASQLQVEGRETEALDGLQRAVALDPARAEARVALGYLLAAQGMAGEAAAELERAAELAPRYADVRYELGLLCSELGRVEDAETHLRAALEAQPGYVLARLALGCLLEARGRTREALDLLQSVRRSGVRSTDLELHLAVLHARLGHTIQARRARARARASSRAALAARQLGD